MILILAFALTALSALSYALYKHFTYAALKIAVLGHIETMETHVAAEEAHLKTYLVAEVAYLKSLL